MLIPAPRPAPDDEPSQVVPADPHTGEHLRPASRGGIAVQIIAALVLMTGPWVATSPGYWSWAVLAALTLAELSTLRPATH
jgi:hypothetical protein